LRPDFAIIAPAQQSLEIERKIGRICGSSSPRQSNSLARRGRGIRRGERMDREFITSGISSEQRANSLI